VGRDPEEIMVSMGDVCHISRDRVELRKEVSKYKPDELSMEVYMSHLIGTPEECIGKIDLYGDLGVSEFVLQFPSLATGDMNDLELFAESVIPVFKGN